jgi:hypothetical protein
VFAGNFYQMQIVFLVMMIQKKRQKTMGNFVRRIDAI